MSVQLCSVIVGMALLAAPAESPVDHAQPLKTLKADFGLADGPAWDGGGLLYVPDVKNSSLWSYRPAKDEWKQLKGPEARISASFYNHGRLYVSDNGNSRIAVRQPDGSLEALTSYPTDAKPPVRPNDLVVDDRGGVYFTLTRQNEVVYIPPSGERVVAISNIDTPNGIILSPDGRTLYVASYIPKKIFAYDVAEDGKTSNERLFATMDDGTAPGADGMSIDRAGNVYCCGAADVWIWDAEGNLLEKLETPTRPINCAFGDSDQQTLYITGFGGVYSQKMRVSGVAPQPPAEAAWQPKWPARVSTEIPDDISAHVNVVYASYGPRKLLADIFVPSKPQGQLPAVLVVHGGGWLKGDKTKFRGLAVDLAKRGFVTAAIEYRLGGEAPFPAAIQDCHAAVRYLRAEADRYHIDPERIGAVGGSAGGHLVGLLAGTANVPELQGDGGHAGVSSAIQAAIVMAGQMQMLNGSVAERSLKNPESSNSNVWLRATVAENPELYGLADAFEHLDADTPPILFMVGEHDQPKRNEPSRERLKELGVHTDVLVYKDGKHGCWNQHPWFEDMTSDMASFFHEQLQAR